MSFVTVVTVSML